MFKYLLITLVFLSCTANSHVQDKITRVNGKTIKCKITSVDSNQISFIVNSSGRKVPTFLKTEDISSYEYKGQVVNLKQINKNNTAAAADTTGKYKKDIEYAQKMENTYDHFIYTFSGKLISGGNVEYRKSIFDGRSIWQAPYFLVGSEKFKASEVKFFKNDHDFFANTKYFSVSSNFARRILGGKINYYEEVRTRNMPDLLSPSTGPLAGIGFRKKIKDYYNFGFDDLKKVNYRNLSNDLSGNRKSMKFLNKYRLENNIQIGLMIVGSLAIAGGIMGIIKAPENNFNPNFTGEGIAIGFGAVCWVTSYFLSTNKLVQLKYAVVAYNRL